MCNQVPETQNLEQNCSGCVDYAVAAYGPTLRISVLSRDALNNIITAFCKMHENPACTVSFVENLGFDVNCAGDLILRCDASDGSVVVRLDKGGCEWVLTGSRSYWLEASEILRGFDGASPAHQYIQGYRNSETIIEVSYLE